MKLVLRLLLLSICAAVLLTGIMTDWNFKSLAIAGPTFTSSAPHHMATDVVLYVVLKVFFF